MVSHRYIDGLVVEVNMKNNYLGGGKMALL
jgi:hypothetical protein